MSVTKTARTTLHDIYGTEIYDKFRSWEVQRKPYLAPLPFKFWEQWRTKCYSYGKGDSFSEQNLGPGDFDKTHATNNCYAKLVGKLGDTATFANNLLEAHGSLDMIVSRANQLGRAANFLRKGRVSDAWNALKRPGVPSRKAPAVNSKDFGNQWLEFHFGWEPLVQDIGAALNVLQDTDFGGNHLSARVSEPFYDHFRSELFGGFDDRIQQGDLSVRMGCYALVTNANAFLANRMGFVNPLSVAWEAVPYSFVVDWFSNVGQVLASMTDFVGVELSRTYTTTFQRGTNVHVTYYPADRFGPAQYTHTEGSSVSCSRGTTIVGPSLKVKPFKGFSFTRGATAISLLLQKLV